jgi:type IV pilus assembly protein PilW
MDMTNLLPPRNNRREIQRGFSLIELMIAITLSLLIMTGLISIFVKNSQARSEIERSNRQIESGRYAMALLTEDLRMAGFLASFNPYNAIVGPNNPPLASMTSMPDPCATSVANLNNSFFFPVQGYDNPTTMPSCVSDARAGSDILVIRRVSTCVAGPTTDAGCDAAVSGIPYFQASNCYAPTPTFPSFTELAIRLPYPTYYQAFFVLDTNMLSMTKHAIDCTTIAPYRRYLTHIYFVANNDAVGDGIPTLKRAELGATGFTIVPLVEGIETIQFEYGVDTNNDGVIDGFTADPNSYSACAGAACVLNWLHTYSVTINLLARNIEKSPGYTDSKTYTLGLKADGTNNVFPATGTYGDAYKRHAYTAAARLENPAARVMP